MRRKYRALTSPAAGKSSYPGVGRRIVSPDLTVPFCAECELGESFHGQRGALEGGQETVKGAVRV
jgi:hypothetical protein